MERTLIILKPDALQRQLVGQILSRFDNKGLQLIGCKLIRLSPELAQRHYAVHKGKAFYEGLIRYITSGPVLALVFQAPQAIQIARTMMGATFGWQAQPGTIRGDLACSEGFNLIHGSDSAESAAQEIGLFFKPEELCEYELACATWLYGRNQ